MTLLLSRSQELLLLSQIGITYGDLGDLNRGIEDYQQALPLFCSIDYLRGEAVVLSNLGQIYEQLGSSPQAIEPLTLALDLFHRLRDDNAVNQVEEFLNRIQAQ